MEALCPLAATGLYRGWSGCYWRRSRRRANDFGANAVIVNDIPEGAIVGRVQPGLFGKLGAEVNHGVARLFF